MNGSDNPAKYRVWDYPIREQYTHILQGMYSGLKFAKKMQFMETALNNVQKRYIPLFPFLTHCLYVKLLREIMGRIIMYLQANSGQNQ